MAGTPYSPGSTPNGLSEANKEGAGVNLQSHAQDAKPNAASQPGDAKGNGDTAVEGDARGQFVHSKEGRENNGVTSASPRVTTGTDDATFENDPGN
ncbi:hypothetical protein JYU29_07695 [Tianweitania sp. BSSL-BM11]|uniref:Uncharacterized protein n=1 Tax=Tianweitania aestuarii TaxID=2814886 RepID=A0ABS5RU82_9HYPH|nr:hypothetical protein [Tianweitania aestuarii]MBS9720566.1 hypothetical protein [Tianweitania aestuarii]